MEVRGSGLDPAYNDALELIKGREYVTYHWIQTKLEIGYARDLHIMNKLEDEGKIEGKIEPKLKGRKKRKVKI